jgi:tRNA A58 N-methylase Trm61
MIEMADLKDGDEVIDLGAGDGRLLFAAAENARVTAYGVEAHADRYEALAARCKQRGDSDRIFLQHCDIREAVLNGCNVVFLYLLSSSNAELKPKLLAECKPGTRIISHDFGMPDWVPDETAKVECEDRPHVVHMWRVPAR